MYLCEYIGTFPDDVESHVWVTVCLPVHSIYVHAQMFCQPLRSSAQKLNKEFALEYNIDMFSFVFYTTCFQMVFATFLIIATVCLYVYYC